MLTLYSGPLSLFTAKVRIALAEKGLGYERIEVGWSRRDRYIPHHPEVARINPKEQVPCLVDGDLEIYDSTLIGEYLEERFPEPPLMPRDPADRARCRRLELEADEVLFPHVWKLIDTRFYPGGDDAAAAEPEQGVRSYQARLQAALGDGPYLLGERFGLADIANGVMLTAAGTLGVPTDDAHPGLAAWMARLVERPSVATELAAMAEAAAG